MTSAKSDPRRSRAWRKLRDQVVEEEPDCRLRFPGVCTFASQTGDHILPVSTHPHLALVRDNVRGACHPCNQRRSDKPMEPPPAAEQAPRPRALDIFRPLDQLT